MLFEEAMMSYRLGVQRDVAITDKPETVTANNISVDWASGDVSAPRPLETVQAWC